MLNKFIIMFIVAASSLFNLSAMAPDKITEIRINREGVEIRAKGMCSIDSEFGHDGKGHPNPERLNWYRSVLSFVSDDPDFGLWKTKWRFHIVEGEMKEEARTWLPGEVLKFYIDLGGLNTMPIHIRDGIIHNVSRNTTVNASLTRVIVEPVGGTEGGGTWETILDQDND